MDYATGHLSPAFEIVIASHLMGCPACRHDLRVAESVGAELALGTESSFPRLPVALSADAIVASTAPTPVIEFWGQGSQLPGALDLTALVSGCLRVSLEALRWRGVGGGVAVARLRNDADDRLWLLRARPGAVLPRHRHSGNELTLVLKGSYVVDERLFAAGALEDADEDTMHQPIVTTAGECICLAATTGPLVFDGWGARLAQRYLGI